jgi:NAD(P)-dependent dehydrogenase (short-subunit alcohol dehydrogenase family)
MTLSTPGIQEDLDPRKWSNHHYGLPDDRWQRLASRSYWVTGAGTGYGLAMASALAAAGAQVFLTGRRSSKLTEAIDYIGSLGINTAKCRPVPADVVHEEEVERASGFIETACPSLHGLINNAAVPQPITVPYPLQETNTDTWDKVFNTNTRGPWLVTRRVLRHMLKGKDIRIIFVTSGAGWSFLSGYGQYNVSKAALNSLTACFAEECHARHPNADIQINGLDPGQAKTEMNPGSDRSPFSVVCMALLLLSHPEGGPNGKFFSHDGRHLSFCNSLPYDKPLMIV